MLFINNNDGKSQCVLKTLYLGRKYAVVCNDYEAVKEALSKTEAITRPVGIFSPIPLGTGEKYLLLSMIQLL
ncbi:hypothetical protein JTE90_005713 [Oedothorax gibbosus]|uniref:Uncharacterized protein n=1 Tax=Oedothorax gibbosus TaxID=931172 RepID=A0AAV6TI97_9ARAC|nr:hypothetical protein JTE90_005713 [Oedothorax gibbosus]